MARKFGVSGANRDPLAYTSDRLAIVPTVEFGRDPTNADNAYPVQTIARNSVTLEEFILTGIDSTGGIWKKFVGAGTGGSMVFISKEAASSSSVIDFTSGITSAFQHYVVYITEAACATDAANFRIRFSNDGGATFETSNYNTAGVTINNNPTVTSSGSAMVLNQDVGNDVDENFALEVHILNPEDATKFTSVYSNGMKINTVGTVGSSAGGGQYEVNETIDAFRFLMSSGDIVKGDFILYGISE